MKILHSLFGYILYALCNHSFNNLTGSQALYSTVAVEATYEWSGLSKVENARAKRAAEKVCLINIHKHFLACVTSTLAIIFGI